MNKAYPKRNNEKIQDFLSQELKKKFPSKGVLMGIDYGSVRIGIALSDINQEIATPFKIISKIKELDDIIPAKNVVGIIIGLPLQPDGTEGKTASQARLFATRLSEKFSLPILWLDERYSSVQTEAFLKDTLFMCQENRKKVLDAYVAARLLQQALNLRKQK